jgi:hypothetical protein
MAAASEAGATNFFGEAVSATDILVRYTYYGDADLSGSVNGDDESLVLAGLHKSTYARWSSGDFDYNQTVNGDDYSLFLAGLRRPTIA